MVNRLMLGVGEHRLLKLLVELDQKMDVFSFSNMAGRLALDASS